MRTGRRDLLLLSSPTLHGQRPYAHVLPEIVSFCDGRDILFIPYAMHDIHGYTLRVASELDGLHVRGVGEFDDLASAFHREDVVIYVGGGNTFRLLKRLQDGGLLPELRAAVDSGTPYMGASAGTVITGRSIRTTNDMPIVWPSKADALSLFPFQFNCHYVDADDSDSRHMVGETRDDRLAEFHEESSLVVVAMREGTWLRVDGENAVVGGEAGGRLFRADAAIEELSPGADLSMLLR